MNVLRLAFGDKHRRGFTIIELLIVIVVIAILAAISIVAYNGIQTRAENSKTVNAVAAWTKALQMYKVDNGEYPSTYSCLGDTNTYINEHNGVCWGLNSNTTWLVNSAFLNLMNPYLKNYPEPSNKDVSANSGGNQFRGAMYYTPGGPSNAEIRVSLFNIASTADCPKISGLISPPFTSGGYTSNRVCYYKLPQ